MSKTWEERVQAYEAEGMDRSDAQAVVDAEDMKAQVVRERELKIYTYEKDFAAFVTARNAGELCRIDEEMFFYWLEVLPPVYFDQVQRVEIDGVSYLKRCSFGFAEGREFITDFWRNTDGNGKGTAFFCKMSNRLNRGG